MTIANMLNINESFLGMTILTYGNSISDLMLNLSLVKLGYGEMAYAVLNSKNYEKFFNSSINSFRADVGRK